MRVTSLLMGVVLAAGMLAGSLVSVPEAYAKKDNHKVTICHATSSAKNPYVTITVDYHSIVKQGHDQHQGDRDIIPALPMHNYPGKNIELLHILEADCKVVDKTDDQPQTPAPTTPQPSQPDKPSDKPSQPNKPGKKDKQHKYTICHATRSATNPYRVITVDYNSIVKMGHGSHDELAVGSYAEARTVKAAGNHWGDVIPAMPEHNFAGRNNDKTGQKLLDNNCKFPVDKPVDEGDKETPPVDETDDQPQTPTPGKGQVEDEVEDQPAVDSLPLTGIASSPLMILLLGALTAGVSYLVAHLSRTATETE